MKNVALCMAVALATANAFSAVYELQMTIKTTKPDQTTFKPSSNVCEAEGKLAYRRPSTIKVKAVMWGEACAYASGYAIWDEIQKVQYSNDSEFGWEFLNRIGKTGTDAEGLWTMVLRYGEDIEAGRLIGGATGKIKGDYQLTLNGNLAGFMYAGQIVKVDASGCTYCGGGPVLTTMEALGWGLCDCSEADERTVAHGTWTLKYNSAASKKYDQTGDIAASYKFPKYVEP